MSRTSLPPAAQYLAAITMVVLATAVAFGVRSLVAAPALTLVYVLPVVIAGTAFAWGPSLVASLAGALAFDFFFTEPYYSLRIYSPSDIWAAGLLLVVAAIVSTVAADARRGRVEADRSAARALALQTLADAVIAERPTADVEKAAVTALSRVFEAPAVMVADDDGGLRVVASERGLKLASGDTAAVYGVLESGLPARAETFPFVASVFDFWRVTIRPDQHLVLGVNFGANGKERPDAPDRYVSMIGGYLAAAERR